MRRGPGASSNGCANWPDVPPGPGGVPHRRRAARSSGASANGKATSPPDFFTAQRHARSNAHDGRRGRRRFAGALLSRPGHDPLRHPKGDRACHRQIRARRMTACPRSPRFPPHHAGTSDPRRSSPPAPAPLASAPQRAGRDVRSAPEDLHLSLLVLSLRTTPGDRAGGSSPFPAHAFPPHYTWDRARGSSPFPLALALRAAPGVSLGPSRRIPPAPLSSRPHRAGCEAKLPGGSPLAPLGRPHRTMPDVASNPRRDPPLAPSSPGGRARRSGAAEILHHRWHGRTWGGSCDRRPDLPQGAGCGMTGR